MQGKADAEFRQGFLLPTLEASELPAWLAEIAKLAEEAQSADLRFQVGESLSLRPFLPHWDAKPHHDRVKVIALRGGLGHAYQAALERSHDLARLTPQPVDVSTSLTLARALVLGIVSASEKAVIDPDATNKIAAFLGDIPDIAGDVAETVRRSRAAAISVFDAGADKTLVLASLVDDSEAGSTLDGMRARLAGDFPLLSHLETPGGGIWLSDRLTIPIARRGFVAEILSALKTLGDLPADHALVILGNQESGLYYAAIPGNPDSMNVEELCPDAFAETPLTVTRIEPVASDTAMQALQKRIADIKFPVGYRVSLHPVGDAMRGEDDIESLREEIAEREAEIELIQALAAPQMRLLRFTDAQLPALVDGLRRMPPEMLRQAELLYAAGHASGRAEPAHFILYDPAKVSIEGRLPEHFWRGLTEDRPIRYWLDPHAAQAMERGGERTFVFTPARHRLLPAIDSFGGALDQTLRLILGNLFADAAMVLEADGAVPVFIFSPPSLSGAEMDVELLDQRWFQPVHLSLRWLNDHMVVRSPRVADRAVLSRLAEDLYEGQVADTLRRGVTASTEELRQVWKEAEGALQAQIDGLLSHVGEEVALSTERLRLGRHYLVETQAYVAEMDALIEKMRAQASAAAASAEAMSQLTPMLADARFDMVGDLLAEIELGDQAMEEAESRVRAQIRKIEQLANRLKVL